MARGKPNTAWAIQCQNDWVSIIHLHILVFSLINPMMPR